MAYIQRSANKKVDLRLPPGLARRHPPFFVQFAAHPSPICVICMIASVNYPSPFTGSFRAYSNHRLDVVGGRSEFADRGRPGLASRPFGIVNRNATPRESSGARALPDLRTPIS